MLSKCQIFENKRWNLKLSVTSSRHSGFLIQNVWSFRYFKMSYGVHCALNIRHDDIVYSSLPLYHSAAGIVGIGQCFIGGCTLALRSKFSASTFWDDCVKTKATVSTFWALKSLNLKLVIHTRGEEREVHVKLDISNNAADHKFHRFLPEPNKWSFNLRNSQISHSYLHWKWTD